MQHGIEAKKSNVQKLNEKRTKLETSVKDDSKNTKKEKKGENDVKKGKSSGPPSSKKSRKN